MALCAPHLLGWAAGTFLRVLLPGSPFDEYGSVLDAAMDSGRFTAFGAPFGFTSLFEWSAVFGPLTFFATDLKEARCYSRGRPPFMAAAGVGGSRGYGCWRWGGSRAGLAPVLPPEGGAGGLQRPVCWADSGCRRAGGLLYGYGLVLSLPLPAPLLMLIGSVVLPSSFCLVCLVAFRGFSRMKRIWAALPAFLGEAGAGGRDPVYRGIRIFRQGARS